MLLFSCLCVQKEWKPEATTILEEFEDIGCLSTEERRKRTIVQLYNHYSTTSLTMSVIVQEYSCTYVGYALYME